MVRYFIRTKNKENKFSARIIGRAFFFEKQGELA